MSSRLMFRTTTGVTAVVLALSAAFSLSALTDEPAKPEEKPQKQFDPSRLQKAPSRTESPRPTNDPNATPPAHTDHVTRDPSAFGQDTLSDVAPAGTTGDPGPLLVEISPLVLNLGDIPAGTQPSASSVKLRNVSDKPVKLLECKASCGCTTAKCPRGHDILPGEEIEVEVSVNPGLKGQPVFSKTVTFKIEGQRDVMVAVNARVIEYVIIEPAELDVKNLGDGKLTLRSIDEQPFVVKEALPDAFDGITDEAKPVHVLTFLPERWEELGKRRMFNFLVDHPKTKSVQSRVKPDEYVPPTTPEPQLTEDQLRAQQLFAAIRSGSVEEALKTIEGGVEVNIRDSAGRTALSMAAEKGDVTMMKALINAKADVEAADRAGFTPLTYASQSNAPEAVTVLLRGGANPNSRDDIGCTPLMWAAGPRGFVDAVRALVDAGADVHTSNTLGMTAMSWAAGFADPERIRLVAKAGADVNVYGGPDDMTPLMWAVQINTVDAVKTLIELGADIHAKDGGRRTAMEYALDRTDDVGKQMIQVLVAAGATPPKSMPEAAAQPTANAQPGPAAPAKAPGN